MSLLNMSRNIMEKFGAGREQNLVGAIAQLLNSPSVGGLTGLAQLFNQRGEGATVNSWISKGENQPIAPDKVRDVLGDNRVREVAQTAGVSERHASEGLASILPQLVNHLTPDGKVPEGDHGSGALSQLAQRFVKH